MNKSPEILGLNTKTPVLQTVSLKVAAISLMFAGLISGCSARSAGAEAQTEELSHSTLDQGIARSIQNSVNAEGSGTTAQDGGSGNGHRVIAGVNIESSIIFEGSGSVTINNYNCDHGHTHTDDDEDDSDGRRNITVPPQSTGRYFYDTYQEQMAALSNRLAEATNNTQRSLTFIDSFLNAMDVIDSGGSTSFSIESEVMRYNIVNQELIGFCQAIASELQIRRNIQDVTKPISACQQTVMNR